MVGGLFTRLLVGLGSALLSQVAQQSSDCGPTAACDAGLRIVVNLGQHVSWCGELDGDRDGVLRFWMTIALGGGGGGGL